MSGADRRDASDAHADLAAQHRAEGATRACGASGEGRPIDAELTPALLDAAREHLAHRKRGSPSRDSHPTRSFCRHAGGSNSVVSRDGGAITGQIVAPRVAVWVDVEVRGR